jgi:FeS assembly protein IscX
MAGKEFTWDNPEAIGVALCREHPKLNPDDVSLQEMHRLATLLTEFRGDTTFFSEGTLEAIRTAWAMEFLDRTQ